MNEPDTLTEQPLEKFLFDVTSVSKDLSIENLCKHRPHSTIPVIYVCSCKTECYHFTRIIAKQVQFKAMTSTLSPLSALGKSIEHLIDFFSCCGIRESLYCPRS